MSNIELIKKAMERLSIDDVELARRSGVHITLIRRYLKGESRIGIQNAPKLARALEMDIGAVLYGVEEVVTEVHE